MCYIIPYRSLNMALIKLPDDIQHSINASSINTVNQAVEELVYNSIDAGATSIAIRVNLKQYFIQVIDNGAGLNWKDLQSIGKFYMTSKFDQSKLNGETKYYGFRGQSIATIVKVSQELKITTRCDGGKETWSKVFLNGQEQKIMHVVERPSKGTTIEIKGFLHNAVIRKRSLQELNELNTIKSFLEKLALVNSHISLTLRDNSTNELMLTIHKKRDILQIFNSMNGILTEKLKEFQVEKNQYKVKAFILDDSGEAKNRYHWIYLNKLIVKNRRIQDILNGLFKKYLRSRLTDEKKTKTNIFQDKDHTVRNKPIVPSYFVLITCPYDEYDYSRSPKQSFLEFKNWDSINKILDKLVKLYFGNLKTSDNKNLLCNPKKKVDGDDTRSQVRKIIEKVLGYQSKKTKILKFQNAIKGKHVKRNIGRKKICNKITIIPIQNLTNSENMSLVKPKPVVDLSKLRVSKMSTNTDIQQEHKKPKHHKRKASSESQKMSPVTHVQQQCKHDQLKPLRQNTITKLNEILPVVKIQQRQANLQLKELGQNANVLSSKISLITHNQQQRKYDQLKHLKQHAAIEYNTLSPDVQQQQKNLQLKDHRQHTDVLSNKMSPATDIQQPYSILKTNCTKSIHVNDFENSSKDFRRECAALKRRCDQLELKVDTFLMGKSKMNPKTFSDVLSTIEYKTKCYKTKLEENANMELSKTTQSPITHKDYFSMTSPYFPPHRLYALEKSVKPVCIDSPIFECRWNLPSKSVTPEGKDAFSIPFSETTGHQRHEKLSLNTFKTHGFDLQQENRKRKLRKFISKQSMDNFSSRNQYSKSWKSNKKTNTGYSYNLLLNNKRPQINLNLDIRTTESYYTIDFSRSNDYEYYGQKVCSPTVNDTDKSYILSNNYYDKQLSDARNVDCISKAAISNINTSKSNEFYSNTHTKSILSTNSFFQKNVGGVWQGRDDIHMSFDLSAVQSNTSFKATYTMESMYDMNATSNNYLRKKLLPLQFSTEIQKDYFSPEEPRHRSDFDVVFISEAQQKNNSTTYEINPVELCEALINHNTYVNQDDNRNNHNMNLCKTSNQSETDKKNDCFLFSVEFENDLTERFSKLSIFNNFEHDSLFRQIDLTEELRNKNEPQFNLPCQSERSQKTTTNSFLAGNFEIKNRQRFLPKGMSPLNLNPKASNKRSEACLDEEYFNSEVYCNFLDDLKIYSDIYEPDVQNMKSVGTKEIQKLVTKVIKDNASLIFDGKTLEKANVLGQVDTKFIAVEIKGRCIESKEAAAYLVLFDQHAVHERIRLEKNLHDYLEDEHWKSVKIDNITLKLTKEEILYLHNYTDKFSQFGLKWCLSQNQEIIINGIPDAVLGKNPRQEDKIVTAVKNVIVEIIKSLQVQRGCVPLYLKTIMDLVFSEACRYAIKFGDKLTIDESKELLRDLSRCKTPFQCAHGRPVMAVLMELKTSPKNEYLVSRDKLLNFRKKMNSVRN